MSGEIDLFRIKFNSDINSISEKLNTLTRSVWKLENK